MQIPALSLAGDNTEVKKWGENKGVEKEKKKLNAELAEWRQKTTIANKQQKKTQGEVNLRWKDVH